MGYFSLYDDLMDSIWGNLKSSNDEIEEMKKYNILTKKALSYLHKNGLPVKSQKQYDEIKRTIESIKIMKKNNQ